MSGFVVVLDLHGEGPAASLLSALTDQLTYRAPDGSRFEVSRGVGMGHAFLRGTHPTPIAADPPNDPTARYWIAADARIDDRATLLAELKGAGAKCRPGDADASLLLAAYEAWGDACVEHLLGDYSFIIWDRETRTGFAARDHFGVKPFYYARVGGTVVLSNTIAAVRGFPGVSGELDDVAIADLLVFGWRLDLDRTSFAAVKALPPAHRMRIGGDSVDVERYWAVPVDEELHYPRVRDYVDKFDAIFTAAVGDRVGPGVTTVMMSGGRDSTAIAATAHRVAELRNDGCSVRAITAVYDRDLPDEERKYATIAAKGIGIPIEIVPVDDYRVLDGIEDRPLREPQPSFDAIPALNADLYRRVARTGTVVLEGHGGDAIQRESASRLAVLLTEHRYVTAAREALEYLRWHRRFPRPGFRSLRKWASSSVRHDLLPLPPWLNPELVQRLGLRERWRAHATSRSPHRTRPEAHWYTARGYWTCLFENHDAGATGIPVEVRYPFLDVRLVRFLLSVPPAQWYNDKGLLRIAMRGRLPSVIVDRVKAPLAVDPIEVRMRRDGRDWLRGATISPLVDRYIRRSAVPTLFGGTSSDSWGGSTYTLYPLLLSKWMETL